MTSLEMVSVYKYVLSGYSDKDTALKNKKKVKFFSERYFCHICIRQAGPLFRAR